MDIPEAMIDFEAENMINDYAMRLRQQGLTIDQYMMFTGMDMDGLKEQMKPQALKTIQSRLVLEAVVADAKIEATDAEIDEEIAKMAEMYGMEVDKIMEYVKSRFKSRTLSIKNTGVKSIFVNNTRNLINRISRRIYIFN